MSTNGEGPEHGDVYERLNRLESSVQQIQETQDKTTETLLDLRVQLARMEATQEATNKLLETLIHQVMENTRQIAECNRRIDATNQQIYETNLRIDATNQRIDATNQQIHETNLRIDATNQQIHETNLRIDAVIEGNARNGADTNERINDTNKRIDRLLYALWGVGAVGFGALAAAFLEFFTR